ncbi:MAG: cation:proton antiporter [Treponema sp.]|nr:cation:proton antiporter [Treponema sp.]
MEDRMDSIQFLLDIAILLTMAKIFGLMTRFLKMPEVVGEIAAGLLVGPAVLGIVPETDFLQQMAEIGVIMLMFEAGLGTDIKKLMQTGVKATVIACAGVLIPLVLGAAAFMAFYGWGTPGSDTFITSLFIGTIMSATSVSITVAVLKEIGKLSGTVGTTITSAAIIDDVIGIIVLTVVIGMKDTSTHTDRVILKAAAFFVIAIGTGIVVHKGFKWLDNKFLHTRRIPIISLCYCLALSYVAEKYFGIADITGAYVAGVVLCNLSDTDYIERRIDISSYMIFAPLFFTGIGLKTSFAAMDTRLLLFSIVFVLIALFGKVFGCGLCAKACGFDTHDSMKIGLGMMTRGEVALITAQKGLAYGLLTADFFTAIILLILVSSVITPVLLKRAYIHHPTD